MSLEFSTFAAEHFEPYVQWFEDESLNKQLGPAPNQEWLEHVLHDATGKQYSVFRAEELVAVVGVVFATKENPVNVISDLAIKPILRSTGLGRQVLAALPLLEEYDAAEDWVAFVMKTNVRALKFFQRNGWELVPDRGKTEVPDSMFELRLVRTAS